MYLSHVKRKCFVSLDSLDTPNKCVGINSPTFIILTKFNLILRQKQIVSVVTTIHHKHWLCARKKFDICVCICVIGRLIRTHIFHMVYPQILCSLLTSGQQYEHINYTQRNFTRKIFITRRNFTRKNFTRFRKNFSLAYSKCLGILT